MSLNLLINFELLAFIHVFDYSILFYIHVYISVILHKMMQS